MFGRRPKHTAGGQPLVRVNVLQAALRRFVESRGTSQAIAIHIGLDADSIRVNVPGMNQVEYGVGPRLHMDQRDLGVVLQLCARAVGRRYVGTSLKQLTLAVKAARTAKFVRERGQQTGAVRVGDIAPGNQS